MAALLKELPPDNAARILVAERERFARQPQPLSTFISFDDMSPELAEKLRGLTRE